MARHPNTLEKPGRVDVILEPVKGQALLCGAIIELVSDGDKSVRRSAPYGTPQPDQKDLLPLSRLLATFNNR